MKDSIYTKLVVKIVDSEIDKRAKVKTKEIDGWVTNTRLNRVYVGDNRKKQLEKEYDIPTSVQRRPDARKK